MFWTQCMLWWKSLWWKHRIPGRPIEKTLDWRTTGGLVATLPIENCTNFAQTILFCCRRRETIGNCFLCTFQTVHEGGEEQAPNIRTHKKGMMGGLVVLCPIQPPRKSQVWLEMNADSGTKTPNEWNSLQYCVWRRDGVKSISNFGWMQFASHIWVYISRRWTYLKSFNSWPNLRLLIWMSNVG